MSLFSALEAAAGFVVISASLGAIGLVVAFLAALEAALLALGFIAGLRTIGLRVAFFAAFEASSEMQEIKLFSNYFV